MSAAAHRESAKAPPEAVLFVSGSRAIAHLDDAVTLRFANIMARQFRILIGDAPGADAAVQRHLADAGYGDVTVFCAGARCRNNRGGWTARRIAAEPSLRGRAFYTVKDKAMARQAAYGFVLWDGRSAGSLGNVRELLAQRKPVLVYLVPERRFITLKDPADLAALLRR